MTELNAVAQKMIAAGFEDSHTGGGCRAWQKRVDASGWFITICDEGNGLGDTLDEPYMVGIYHDDGLFVDAQNLMSLDEAMAWGAKPIALGGESLKAMAD